MSNENIQNTALSESIVLLEKCLDTMLAEQRKSAHNAIDMDDWNKAEEILARSKNNIVRIESLKNKFNEFKNEAVRLEFLTASEPAASEQPKPVGQPAPSPKPEAQTSPAKPAEQPKPAPKPTEPAKPAAAKPAEPQKPVSKPAEPTKPAPAPASAPTPAPKPTPAPAPKPAPTPAPKPAEQTTARLDFEMDDLEEPKTDPNNPIILACEELITRFPFSMKLISKNDKIGKFFKDDEASAKRDLSKPAQLSSGLWVETNVPEERLQVFIRSIKRYCDESVNA